MPKKEKKDLITLPTGGEVAEYDDELFKKAAKTGDYLPRFQLMTANSEQVKSGEFPTNHFALVQDQKFIDLGEKVDGLIVAWRPKALEIDEIIVTVHDPDDEEFQRIMTKSNEPGEMSCMYGPEFLLWLPESGEFTTFFMCSKSMRRESPNVKSLMRKGATFKSKKISTPKFTWWSAIAEKCTTPFDLPDQTKLEKEYHKFMNPEVKTVERVDKEATRER